MSGAAVLTAARETVSLSVVSHGQAALVNALLNDLRSYGSGIVLEVFLTVNIPEALPDSLANLPFPVKIIYNSHPLGFAENHNRALGQAAGAFFCIVNPDIHIGTDIFPVLLNAAQNLKTGIVAPLVTDGAGKIENSARFFPTPLNIICKACGGCRGGDYAIGDTCVFPDWVGGMFMLCRREVYQLTRGFDEKFFLYYEDVDLCARVWLLGLDVVLVPQASVVHDARRSSHKQWSYFLHHIRSMSRFFLSLTFWRASYLRRLERYRLVE